MPAAFAFRPWWSRIVLLAAMLGVALLYRNSVPPAVLCVQHMTDPASGTTPRLPLRVADATGARTLSLEHVFEVPAASSGLAVYISHAAPIYSLVLNGRDLTPEVDFSRHEHRSRGPHLHPLANDALREGRNTLLLRLPVARTLGDTRLGQVCVGERTALHGVWLANWWRQTGITATCLALLVILGLIATTLASLQHNLPIWRWYIVCVVLAACRMLYVLSPVMPLDATGWRALSDLSVLLFVFAMYRLLCQFWAVLAHRWSTLLLLGAIVVRTAMTLAGLVSAPNWELGYWIAVALLAGGLIIELSVRARHAPLAERTSLRWALGFAIACAVLETTSKFVFPLRSTIGIYPLGTTVLVIVLGVLLARRASAGTRLLGQAARRLGHRIDDSLLNSPAASGRVWDMVSGELAHDERQYMLDVINDGFGARLLAVLTQIRQHTPHSQLATDIQRALLDLRLMIDAIDGSCQSLGTALSTLRRRMEAPLAAAGMRSQWQIDAVAELKVGSSRRLTELFRCIEELLSNAIQHAGARTLQVAAQLEGSQIVLAVNDDGRGVAPAAGGGRGLRNVELRMRALGGRFSLGAGADGIGTCAELRWPRP